MAYERLDLALVADWNDRGDPCREPLVDYRRRALWIWPGSRTARVCAHNDPVRIARLVAGRTSEPVDAILALLLDPNRTDAGPAVSR